MGILMMLHPQTSYSAATSLVTPGILCLFIADLVKVKLKVKIILSTSNSANSWYRSRYFLFWDYLTDTGMPLVLPREEWQMVFFLFFLIASQCCNSSPCGPSSTLAS